jgi:hypothetical protein
MSVFKLVRNALVIVALAALVTPSISRAATLGMPQHLALSSGGDYTVDSTPSFSWGAATAATWYDVSVDSGSYVSVGNSLSYTSSYLWDGNHVIYVRSHDAYGDTNSNALLRFEVNADDNEDEDASDETGPTVPTVSPSTATEDERVTISVKPYGDETVRWCDLYVNGVNKGDMDRVNGNLFEIEYTFSNDGTYTVYATCTDDDYNTTTGESRSIRVYNEGDEDDDSDEDGPEVPKVTPSTATEDKRLTISVEPDGNNVRWCDLYVNGSNKGDMERVSSGLFEIDYTFSNDGTYTVYASCTDEDYNTTVGASRTIRVYEAGDEDNDDEDMTVPAVTPTTAVEDESTVITVKPYGDNDIESCNLYVNGSNKGAMTKKSSNTFQKNYTFATSGTYTVYAYCTDEDGRTEKGATRSVKVSRYDEDSYDGDTGRLVKMTCSAGAGVNDPCKAVYYYGDDGMRHAFPNESVYFTWFSNFNDVEEVSASTLASMTLGKNVTYRPGSVLVKFASSSDLYAVEEGGILHRYLSSALVRADWGTSWSSYQVIVPEAFFGNYSVGTVIDSEGDYDRSDALASTVTIDDNF